MFNSLSIFHKNFDLKTSYLKDIFHFLSNGFSLILLACSNLLINLYLARYFDAQKVGQFNLLISFFIILGQVSALGVHLSCLYHLHLTQDKISKSKSIHAAINVVFFSGLILALILSSSAHFIEHIFHAPGLGMGLKILAPAIIFYGINKVFISILNISNRLHALAFCQGLRPMLWIVGILFFFINQNDAYAFFAKVFLVTELSLLLIFVVLLKKDLNFNLFKKINIYGMKQHFEFGMKAFPSHFLTDLNTRIDVLMLAYFFPQWVGNYSFIALLIEGLLQIGILLRTITTSRFANALAQNDANTIQSIKDFFGKISFILTLFSAIFLYILYLPGIQFFGLDPSLNSSHHALGIMLMGTIISASAAPFNMALLLAGKPLYHSQLILILCAINMILNLILIPFWGITGAAVAMSFMLVSLPIGLRYFSKKHLGVAL